MAREAYEIEVNWEEGDEMALVYTNHPQTQRRLKRLGFEVDHEDTIEIPITYLFGSPAKERRQTNRPEKTVEQRIQHLFRLRKGKMEKANGKKLTKKQEKDLLEYCTSVVMAKVEADAEPNTPTRPEPDFDDEAEPNMEIAEAGVEPDEEEEDDGLEPEEEDDEDFDDEDEEPTDDELAAIDNEEDGLPE